LTLTPGTRLGAYEITALLGAGGMGEVYRATDTNLKRSVAIKVLPKAVAPEADRLTLPARSRSPGGAEPSQHRGSL
jgi:serine/threonine protein kinase